MAIQFNNNSLCGNETRVEHQSEIQIETDNLEKSFSGLFELINILERRLLPIMTPTMPGACGASDCMPTPTLSPIGYQLRGYSEQIGSVNDRLTHLLQQLALD